MWIYRWLWRDRSNTNSVHSLSRSSLPCRIYLKYIWSLLTKQALLEIYEKKKNQNERQPLHIAHEDATQEARTSNITFACKDRYEILPHLRSQEKSRSVRIPACTPGFFNSSSPVCTLTWFLYQNHYSNYWETVNHHRLGFVASSLGAPNRTSVLN